MRYFRPVFLLISLFGTFAADNSLQGTLALMDKAAV
jgi:hypothetical protein